MYRLLNKHDIYANKMLTYIYVYVIEVCLHFYNQLKILLSLKYITNKLHYIRCSFNKIQLHKNLS